MLTLCMLFLSAVPAAAAEALQKNGTTPTNLARGGKIASDGQTIYIASGEAVYMTPISGGPAKKLFDPSALGISDWGPGRDSYVGPSLLSVWNGALYFAYQDKDNGARSGVYRYDLVSGTAKWLVPGLVKYLSVENGVVTYALWNNAMQDVFYQMNPDGSNDHATGAVVGERSSAILVMGGNSFFVADGWIYYQRLSSGGADALTSNRLYRMRLDGSQKSQINAGYVDNIANNFSVSQGRIYFNQGKVHVSGKITYENQDAAFCTALPDGSDKREINLNTGYTGRDGDLWAQGMERFTVWDGKIYEPFFSYYGDEGKAQTLVRVTNKDGTGAKFVFKADEKLTTGISAVYTVPGWLFLDVTISDQWSTGIKGDPYRFGIYRVKQDGSQSELLTTYSQPAMN